MKQQHSKTCVDQERDSRNRENPGPYRAELLGSDAMERDYKLKRQTWRKLRLAGRGPRFVRLGNRVFYRRSDVEAWIDSHKFNSTAEVTASMKSAIPSEDKADQANCPVDGHANPRKCDVPPGRSSALSSALKPRRSEG